MTVANQAFTPENIASSELLEGLKLSPDGTRALYLVRPTYKADEHPTCAVWIADIGIADSARQLTSGLFNDASAAFHPDGQRIVFLSDRHKAGGPSQFYVLNLSGGEAISLFGKDNKKGVEEFSISPDGDHVAFTSLDEPSEEDEQKSKDRDDPKVFGDTRNFARLRLYTFSTGNVRTLNTDKARHVSKFTWKPDSTELLFCTLAQAELEYNGFAVPVERIVITEGNQSCKLVGTYPHDPDSEIVWTPGGELIQLQSYHPQELSDAFSVHIRPSDSFSDGKRLYGETEDAVRLVDLQCDDNSSYIAVEVAAGLESRIDILHDNKRILTIYETHEEALHGWDVKRINEGVYVLVAMTSSGVSQRPKNLWSGTTKDHQIRLSTKLSSHMQWLEDAPTLKTYAMTWKADDGVELQGIVYSPNVSNTSPLPTIMLVHGGPYFRDVLSYSPSFAGWHQLLASRGYLILSPNYRGGSGRGSAFAHAAHEGMGTVEWDDCYSMVQEAIHRGLADPSRLGIGGWSQGGFMTAWGVTKTKNLFKAGVMGAGISDWGMMAAESDMPEFELDLVGSAPWTPGERKDFNGSPIRYIEGVETPVLILHGEKDERVPVTQAIAFHRGLRRVGKHHEGSKLVIYPREPHAFKERAHAKDVMKRVIEHFDAYLRPGEAQQD